MTVWTVKNVLMNCHYGKPKIITLKYTRFQASAMAKIRSLLFWIVILRGLVVVCRDLGPTGCHETMVNNNQYKLLNNPEDQRSHTYNSARFEVLTTVLNE